MLKKTILCFAFSAMSMAVFAQQSERQMGFDSYQAGDYAKAAEHYKNAVAEDKKDKAAWLYLGASYVHLKSNKEARRAFSNWNKIKKQPSDGEPFTSEELKITKTSHARLNQEVRKNYPSGDAKVLVEFKSDGTIGFVHIFMNTAPGWEPELIDASRAVGFVPAAKDGVPVTVIRMMEFKYGTI